MNDKLNNNIINILVFTSIVILLIPYNTLLGDLRNYPIYDLYVSGVYIFLLVMLLVVAKSFAGVKLFCYENLQLGKITGVSYYIGALIVATLLKKDLLDILTVVISIVYILPFFIIVSVARRFEIRKPLIFSLMICTTLGFIICFYDNFINNIYRSGCLTGNANTWSAYLMFILPLALYGVINYKNQKGRIIAGAFLLGIIVSLVIAKSRAVFLALICVVIFYIIYEIYKYKKGYAIAFGLAIILLMASLLPFLQQIVMRGYDQERMQAYIAAYKMFLDNPIIGVGYKHYEMAYQTLYHIESSIKVLPHAHCMYLQYLATTGLIGFSGLLAFLFKFLHFLFQKSRDNVVFKYSIIGMAFFIIHGAFDSVISNLFFYRICWMFFAVYVIGFFREQDN